MKQIYLLSVIFFAFFLFTNNKIIAQSIEEENEKKFSQMEQSSLRGKVLLNKAILLKEFIDPFESQYKDKEGNTWTAINTETFEELINIAERGHVNNEKISPEIKKIKERNVEEIENSNIISIGIINFEAVLLTEEQVESSVRAKQTGVKVDVSEYKSYRLIAAGLFENKLFQGNVKFQLNKNLFFGDRNVEKLEIDFLDGKGWQLFDYQKNEFLEHSFIAAGDAAINIKLTLSNGETFVTDTSLRIALRS